MYLVLKKFNYNFSFFIGYKKPLKVVWPDCEALTFDLETWNLQGQGQKYQWKELMKDIYI